MRRDPAGGCPAGGCAIADYAGAVAVDSLTHRVYVANHANPGAVTVLDAITGTAVGSPIAVGHGPTSIAVNERTNTIYVADTWDGTICVIDGASGAVTATIATGVDALNGIAVNSATNKVYVLESVTRGAADERVAEIDGTSHALTGRLYGLIGLSSGTAIAVDEARNRVIVPEHLAGGIVGILDSIDLVSGVAESIPVVRMPTTVAIDGAHRRAYVGSAIDGSVSVVNLDVDAVAATVPVGDFVGSIAVDPATQSIFVNRQGNGDVAVIDGKTNLVVADLPVGTHAGRSPLLEGIAVDTTTHVAFVAKTIDDALASVSRPDAAPAITPSDELAGGKVRLHYQYDLGSTGFPAPRCSATGTLPAGVKLGADSCVLSGTPTRAGTFDFEVTATNSAGSATSDYEVVVRP